MHEEVYIRYVKRSFTEQNREHESGSRSSCNYELGTRRHEDEER